MSVSNGYHSGMSWGLAMLRIFSELCLTVSEGYPSPPPLRTSCSVTCYGLELIYDMCTRLENICWSSFGIYSWKEKDQGSLQEDYKGGCCTGVGWGWEPLSKWRQGENWNEEEAGLWREQSGAATEWKAETPREPAVFLPASALWIQVNHCSCPWAAVQSPPAFIPS